MLHFILSDTRFQIDDFAGAGAASLEVSLDSKALVTGVFFIPGFFGGIFDFNSIGVCSVLGFAVSPKVCPFIDFRGGEKTYIISFSEARAALDLTWAGAIPSSIDSSKPLIGTGFPKLNSPYRVGLLATASNFCCSFLSTGSVIELSLAIKVGAETPPVEETSDLALAGAGILRLGAVTFSLIALSAFCTTAAPANGNTFGAG